MNKWVKFAILLQVIFALPVLASKVSGEELIEFKAGDSLPLKVHAKGDLFESNGEVSTTLKVKRNFWVKVKKDEVLASLDGSNFEPFNKLFDGSFQIGAEPLTGKPAQTLHVYFNADLSKRVAKNASL